MRGPRHESRRAAERARHGGSSTRDALHRIARDEGLVVSPSALAAVARDRSLRADLLLWSYAVGLVHRSRGGGEGEAAWEIWRSMRRAGRRTLDAEAVWAARERLRARLAARAG